MAYNITKDQNKNTEIVISGFEKGVASSPHQGIANLQNVNISTETGEVMCSYNRVKQSQSAVGNGTLTRVNTNTVSFSNDIKIGSWITIIADSGTSLSGSYYVESVSGAFKLSTTFAQTNATIVTGINAGTATYSVISMGAPICSSTEVYGDSLTTTQTRYYILDGNGLIWVHDTKSLTGIETPLWFLPNLTTDANASGMAVLNGWLLKFSLSDPVFWKPTVNLGSAFTNGGNSFRGMSTNFHSTLIGRQNILYYTDGRFIGSIFPTNASFASGVNLQSYCSYTAVTDTGTLTAVICGSAPFISTTIRTPVMFFAGTGGNVASSLDTTSIWYIELGGSTFKVYNVTTGGSFVADITTGASGTQYFNTFSPVTAAGLTMMTITNQHVAIPLNEKATCLAELGNNIIVGTSSNVLYPWDQHGNTFSDIIPLPENGAAKMITVNQVAYVFAGHKGNVYITNGSSASLAISVPDYCAGIAGTPTTYIEPYFSWGDAMFLRGRVYFSILDQTATKAGNCGGVWSFIPTNNIAMGETTGIALRLENQNSYATYNGYCPVLIPSQNQLAISPQYWSGWISDINTPTYGIDFTGTFPSGTTVIETDLMPVGTMLQKATFQQIEYKLSSPLASGESVSIAYRQNSTDAYVDCGTANVESATDLAGYFTVNFEKIQWLQLRITLTPLVSSSSSFIRLREIRVR